MNIIITSIKDLIIIKPKVFSDKRGHFFESYNSKIFKEKIGDFNFIQDNESKSTYGVLRGLHFQKPPFEQTKWVRCVSGNILDVAVDLRESSKTFGKFFTIELSSINNKQLLIPKGFAHGFQVLSDQAIVNYKVDEYYNPVSESGIIWDDNDLQIKWNIDFKPILSEKDLQLISFKELKSPF